MGRFGYRILGFGSSPVGAIPVGLIVPFLGTTAPGGWTDFSDADGKYLVGAGSTYGVGATGGSSTVTFSATSSSSAHSGVGSATAAGSGGTASNNHSHTIGGSGTAEDVYKYYKLIQAAVTHSELPGNSLCLADTTLSGANVGNVESSVDKFLRANATAGATGGSATPSIAWTVSNENAHTHSGSFNGNTGGAAGYYPAAGAHSHAGNWTSTLNTKRLYLSAWGHASLAYELSANAIGMWESGTAPDGWAVCDGNNGTPDCRDFFIRAGTTGNHGTTSGDNTSNWSTTSDTTGAHSHTTASSAAAVDVATHSDSKGSHSHTASDNGKSVVMPYYALTFIMYLG